MIEQLLNGEQNMKAAVFFPGIGYHCDKPLLYYSRKLAQECGYEDRMARAPCDAGFEAGRRPFKCGI